MLLASLMGPKVFGPVAAVGAAGRPGVAGSSRQDSTASLRPDNASRLVCIKQVKARLQQQSRAITSYGDELLTWAMLPPGGTG